MRRVTLLIVGIIILAVFSIYLHKIETSAPASTYLNRVAQNVGNQEKESFSYPISSAVARMTKKPFGIFVSPGNSPVSPERFSGYHTGLDFETFPDEQNSDVSVYAACSGKLLVKKWAGGYGGVAIESCEFRGQPVTVIYGHLNFESIIVATDSHLATGEFIGTLGNGYSVQTDGERKHLHFGIHKGSGIDLRGYVATKAELGDWMNPADYLK